MRVTVDNTGAALSMDYFNKKRDKIILMQWFLHLSTKQKASELSLLFAFFLVLFVV